MKRLKHIEHLIKVSAGRCYLTRGSRITTRRVARKHEVQLRVPTVKNAKLPRCLSSSFRTITMCTYVTSWPSQLSKLRVKHYRKVFTALSFHLVNGPY